MTQDMERELSWEDEIEKDGGDWVLLPEGEYDFTVNKFERGRFQGSAKMPPCNQAKLELIIHSLEHGDVTVFHNLFLHTKTEGLLSNFFVGIGQKKKGGKLRMNWNAVIGAKGRLKLEINKFTGNDGKERTNNQVKTFLDPEDYQQNNQVQSNIPNQQQAPSQNQAPFPTGQQQSSNYTPGQF
jgi:hypothetical protein